MIHRMETNSFSSIEETRWAQALFQSVLGNHQKTSEIRLERKYMPAPGDILLFYHPRGLSRFITLLTRSPFYHVAIYAGSHEVIEAIPSGVVRRDINPQGRVRHHLVIAAPKGKGPATLAWAETKIGDGYDSKNLAGLVLDRVFAHLHVNFVIGDRYTCGEFVASAFEAVDVRLFSDIDAADVLPADFARLLPDGIPKHL
jgi:uncharacterized protein YycO